MHTIACRCRFMPIVTKVSKVETFDEPLNVVGKPLKINIR